MPGLDQCADLPQLAVMDGHVEIVDGHRAQTRDAVDRGPVVDRRFENRLVEFLVKAGEQPPAPIGTQRGERTEKTIGAPIRDPGHDQMPRWGDAGDRLAMIDMLRDQLTGQRTHADFITAISDRYRLPRSSSEELIERRCV